MKPRFEQNPFSAKSSAGKKSTSEFFSKVLGKEAAEEYEQMVGEEVPEGTENEREHVEISYDERAAIKEAPRQKQSFPLENVPKWKKLPREEDLKEVFELDYLGEDGEFAERPMTDFVMKKADLMKIGLSEARALAILSAMKEAGSEKESPMRASAFDLDIMLQQKKMEDPSHPNELSMKEIYEEIDDAGYRPATLPELLAYARDYWTSEQGSEELTDDERFSPSNIHSVYALGSVFKASDKIRSYPAMRSYQASDRCLEFSHISQGGWIPEGERILVIRK